MDEIGSGDRLAADSSKKDEIKHVSSASGLICSNYFYC